jgi:hypothetical protein
MARGVTGRGHPSGARTMKLCKISRKGARYVRVAARRPLRLSLDRDSTGAYRSDGRDRAMPQGLCALGVSSHSSVKPPVEFPKEEPWGSLADGKVSRR